ncbi:MAG: copper chaperone PCu(A)C [Pseudomonadota bacterium]
MIRSSLLALVVVLATACDSTPPAPAVSNAWVRAVPPERRMTAAYFVITNSGDAPLTVVDVRAGGFGRAEMHRTIEEDGISRMRRVDAIAVPAGDELRLAPGGLHVMLMAAEAPIEEGAVVDIELEFDDASTLLLSAPVRRSAPNVD